MRTHVRHNLSARDELSMELILKLLTVLEANITIRSVIIETLEPPGRQNRTYIFHSLHPRGVTNAHLGTQ